MGTPLRNDSSAGSSAPLCDDLTTATDSTASLSTARVLQGDQLKASAPVLLYVNSPLASPLVTNKVTTKVSHGGRGTEAVSTSSDFTHDAIVHLIEAMQRCRDVYNSRERALLFQGIQKELESHGHAIPVDKIRRKWNNLLVTYKRVKDRSSLCGAPTKTSWEYFELMDNVLGQSNISSSPASATLVGFATPVKAGSKSTMSSPCLLPPGLITTSSQLPTLVSSPMLCKVTPKINPSPSCSTDTTAVSSKPASLINRQPLKRKLKRLRLNSLANRAAQQQGQALERTSLLRSFLSSQEERTSLDEQRQRKIDARERRKEKTARAMADAITTMATAMELISSKQDTIIALLQRLADKH